MEILLTNDATGTSKNTKIGFSWTVFFFGFFVPFIRGDWKWGVIMLIIAVAGLFTAGILTCLAQIVFSFIYNKLYTKDLVRNGYKPTNDAAKNLLISKGIEL